MPTHTYTHGLMHTLKISGQGREWAARGHTPSPSHLSPVTDLPLRHRQLLHPPEPRDLTSGTW